MNKTFIPKDYLQQRKWQVIDASGVVLGRLAVQIANILRDRN
ncbi:MAG: uL13 family ribosomal protein, partial [Verrucomicrobia bacterium]|nr:uL13 family ribosomal protein [Verrucomicrobiota bacterium]